MRNVIRQSVVLPAPADQLFQSYLDPRVHGAITGAPVTIAEGPGSEFHAFEGKLSGQIPAVTKPSPIVQSWRSIAFKPEDPDSTLILYALPLKGTRDESTCSIWMSPAKTITA